MTPARPLQRLGAFALDFLLVLFALGLGNWLGWLLGRSAEHGWMQQALVHPFLPLASALVLVLTILLFWIRLQGTPGALLMGIRLVDTQGGRPGARRALLRLLAYIPALAVGLLGILWMLWDRERRGWHDILSDTRLVQEDEATRSLARLMREAGA
ncbi:RDD family protein [Thiohalobacter thiocyanaticus]|uniref:RDD family protein n=1 Tax=Thiohalobacter thiocyanaticus TaxID=585455 RepID=UPI001319C87C|nr:RDD family protein [Thiohalobacter thiocyanaticus]